MAPIATALTAAAMIFARNALVESVSTSSSQTSQQWQNPGNILDLLLLVGGDVVRVALAQLTGSRWPTPVVFSFGWVSYAFTLLVSAVGDKKLLPPPDVPSIVINVKSGYARTNASWMLGRLLRDYEEKSWMDPDIRTKFENMLNPPDGEKDPKQPYVPRTKAGLCIGVYAADENQKAGVVRPGKMFFLGYLVTVLQLVIAALPWILYHGSDYIVFVITCGGTILTFIVGSLSQWHHERFKCRKNTNEDFALTRGNGAQHVIVILSKGHGLHFEDLAGAGEGHRTTWLTQLLIFSCTIFWIALLITVDGLRSHTWFLVAVGGLGSVYTIFAAGLPQKPEQIGIPLKYEGQCFVNEKSMIALMEAEKYKTGLGRCLLSTFFPGKLSDKEEAFWKKAKEFEELGRGGKGNKTVDARAQEGFEYFKKTIDEAKAASTDKAGAKAN